EDRVAPRALVHQQVEVAAAVALLDVRDAVERVRERRADLRKELEPADCEGGLAAFCLRSDAGDPDDVAEVEVDGAAELVGLGEQLDAAAAVDEVEEHQLPHVA